MKLAIRPRCQFGLAFLAVLLASFAAAPAAQADPPPTEGAARTALYASAHFQVVTDLSPDQAEELLDRLETMLTLVSGYWGRRLHRPIQMYLVDDLARWPQDELNIFPPAAIASIRNGGGLTVTGARRSRNGRILETTAVVFSSSAHGSAQHEAVHAYCGLAFGNIGPVWYSEGMAEVGKYWKEGEKGVNAPGYVIRYLQSAEPKPLEEIVNNPLETTGDSWKNYAWRWALCHLLGTNENYAPRFKPLGLGLLSGKPTSFARIYGTMDEEIKFEFRLFLNDMERGYRCDLCSWDWKARFTHLEGTATASCQVEANRGWQASGARVAGGRTYRITAGGEWRIEPGAEAVGAAGDSSGKGRLVGAVFTDYALGEVVELGESATFTAPADGKLFLRCRDDWGRLADNQGSVTARVQLAD